MMKPNFVCGLDAALAVIGGKWKPLILFHLAHDARRYADLRRAIGNVSDKMLIQQLKELEADGSISGKFRQRSSIRSLRSARLCLKPYSRFARGEQNMGPRLRNSCHDVALRWAKTLPDLANGLKASRAREYRAQRRRLSSAPANESPRYVGRWRWRARKTAKFMCLDRWATLIKRQKKFDSA